MVVGVAILSSIDRALVLLEVLGLLKVLDWLVGLIMLLQLGWLVVVRLVLLLLLIIEVVLGGIGVDIV